MDIQDADWFFQSDDARTAHAARESLRLYLHSVGARAEAQDAAELILGELIANVIRHAPGHVSIWLERDGHERVLNVLDRGQRPWSYNVPLTPAALTEHGRGVLIAQTYAKNMRFRQNTDPRGTHVTAVLPA